MGKHCFGPHALERAKERYGLDMTAADMRAILWDCQTGIALLGRTNEHGHTYLARLRGEVVVPVLNETKDFIITFMERDHFVSGSSRRFYKRVGKGKQKAATSRLVPRQGYKRERITIAQAKDEL